MFQQPRVIRIVHFMIPSQIWWWIAQSAVINPPEFSLYMNPGFGHRLQLDRKSWVSNNGGKVLVSKCYNFWNDASSPRSRFSQVIRDVVSPWKAQLAFSSWYYAPRLSTFHPITESRQFDLLKIELIGIAFDWITGYGFQKRNIPSSLSSLFIVK